MHASSRRGFLKSASAAALGLSAFSAAGVWGAEPKRKRVLYFTASVGYEIGRASCRERV